jgi:hypothetical protein
MSDEIEEILEDPEFQAELDGLLEADFKEWAEKQAEKRASKPPPPPPKPGCVCPKNTVNCEYNADHQPLDCPGGDLCFTKVNTLKGRALTKAMLALMRAGVCVCHCGWVPTPQHWRKRRREGITIQCGCGAWWSNAGKPGAKAVGFSFANTGDLLIGVDVDGDEDFVQAVLVGDEQVAPVENGLLDSFRGEEFHSGSVR